ncbi:alpha/beta fold hydrolase [Stigmatella sp. ncwal1]|uniref:Alpha/beta fold hydrolase n=1 Tax=Stigmatella ashevillensis TaxID=2995309 RepID=A0ABT5D2Q7_9BACT|nr:alpha/beta fold hydrolase [Stigmatella ashevillena]MDC0707948.1 alpha/beta fold hydrolase [Stigmatella ashevillena]
MNQRPWKKLQPLWLASLLVSCTDPSEVGLADTHAQTHALVVASVKVPITASMVKVDATRPAIGNHAALYDEQDAIGDPRGGTGAKPVTTWGNVVYSPSDYPMGFFIDLGQAYDVTEVGVFDTYDTGDITFDVGEPGAWTPAVTFSTNLWEKWKLFPVNQRTRYLHFTRTLYASVNELVVYGSPVDPSGPSNVPPTVSAGSAQTVALPTSTATLAGTASDSDGTVVSRQWTQTTGPNTAVLTNATALTTTASGLVVGTYTFQLTVTDDDGASASSQTKVTVNPAPTGRGTTTEVYKSASTPGNYGYVVYLPPGYTEGSNWPVVFFLHGMGQRGNGGTTELKRVRELGPQRYIDQQGKDYPFVLISPQAGPSSTWSPYEAEYYLNPFLNHILATYKVDPRRVYMTGLSLGGGGAFSYSMVYPSKLAGIVAVCPTSWPGNPSYANGMIAAGLPIWAAQAVNDEQYSYMATVAWFDQFGQAMGATGGMLSTYTSPHEKQTAFFRPATGRWEWISGQTSTDPTGAGPARPVLFTLYDTGGHGIWDKVYQDPKVWDWLLAQQRP